jgi:uncharacterized protein (TIGR03032 family)
MRFCVPTNKVASEILTRGKDPGVLLSDGFDLWLQQNRLSLTFTEKQSGQLYFVGVDPNDGRVAVNRVTARGAGALYRDEKKLWLSTSNHLHGFIKTDSTNGSQFAPLMTIATGPRDIQDVILDSQGCPVYCAAHDDCLATVGYSSAFEKVWTPPFISNDDQHDCSHISGMSDDGEQLRYVTVFSGSSDEFGWKSNYIDRGEVWDITDDTIVASNLTLPSSPRFYRSNLWLLNSGAAEVGFVDVSSGKFSAVFKCPGYPTGLAFFDKYALIGLSNSVCGITPSRQGSNDSLQPCGLILINVDEARIVHWIRFRSDSAEVASVAFMPDTTMPISMKIGQKD